MTEVVRAGDLVTVTHRLHPLVGRCLPVRAVRGSDAESLLCERPDGGLVIVLRSWTDRAPDAPCVQDREPGRAAAPGARPAARPRLTGGRAFQVSDTALHRLRASLARSVERLVGLDAAVHATADFRSRRIPFFGS
ncbi:hypothetical protein [Streptomyces thermospinosisporus]|uniref:hypothetical protein n=1 Tax=Streptomyces thermospinosisporus TaxID=161482 RepID=UPI0031D3B865